MFSELSRSRKIQRRRSRIKKIVSNRDSINKKVIIYIFRSNKNFHVMTMSDGNVVASVNSIKVRRLTQGPMRLTVSSLVNVFYNKFSLVYPNILEQDIIFDIRYYNYSGNIKLFIESFRSCLRNSCYNE